MMTKQPVASCPICQHAMQRQNASILVCTNCQQAYAEALHCPSCGQQVERIQGCGAVNYLCYRDGLISANKVEYRYQATKLNE